MVRKEMAFTVEEYMQRLDRVRATMRQKDVDLIVVTGPENICYVSGFRTVGYYYIQALLVPESGDLLLVTRLFEQRNADAFSWLSREHCIAYKDTDDPVAVIAHHVKKFTGGKRARIGFEKSYLSFVPIGAYERLVSLLPDVTIVDSSGIVETHRRIKSAKEIEYLA
jgi:Xaa-Pro dipeptidase